MTPAIFTGKLPVQELLLRASSFFVFFFSICLLVERK